MYRLFMYLSIYSLSYLFIYLINLHVGIII